jgi:hypothetical protein
MGSLLNRAAGGARRGSAMTQVKELTNAERNQALAEKMVMGYTVYHYDKDVTERCYYMLMDPDFDPVLIATSKGWNCGQRRTRLGWMCRSFVQSLLVVGISENYFVMTRNHFGQLWYSVCEKKPWDGIRYNHMVGGMFHCCRDNMIFGWMGFDYKFDDQDQINKYLQAFETRDRAVCKGNNSHSKARSQIGER